MNITPITISSAGDSFWSSDPERTITVDKTLFKEDEEGNLYEVLVYGPTTKWQDYTDSGISQGVNEKILPIIQKKYPHIQIKGLSWSEQGMQPSSGWSFDVF